MLYILEDGQTSVAGMEFEKEKNVALPPVPGKISDVDFFGVEQDGVALVDQIPVAGRRAIVDWAFGVDEGLAAATKPKVFEIEKWHPKQVQTNLPLSND